MEGKKLISIIVPVYNVEKYIDKCIKSILSQSYNNLEIILVNDGSTDQSGIICDSYAEIDARIKVIHKENGGLSDARNTGLEVASGEYVGFIDSDDWIDSGMFEALYNACEENEAEISTCGYYEVHGEKLKLCGICTDKEIFNQKEALMELVCGDTFGNYACNKLYKLSLFENIRYPKGHNMEDIFTTYKLFLKAKKIALVETAFYYYVINRPGSILTNISIKSLWSLFYVHYHREKELITYLPEAKNVMLKYSALAALRFINAVVKENSKEEYKEEYNAAIKYIIDNMDKIVDSAFINRFNKLKLKLVVRNPKFPNMLQKIYDMLRNKIVIGIYSWIRSEIICNRNYKRNISNQTVGYNKRIYLFGLPEHNNLGDHAIAFAEIEFLKGLEGNCEVIPITENETFKNIKYIKKTLNKNDIIALTGGGDIGNQYMYIEERRRKIIQAFPNNKVIIFPQTVYFTEDSKGKKEEKKSARIYGKNKNLTLYTREEFSFENAKKIFWRNNVEFCPDMVISLERRKPVFERSGALLILRSDIEGTLNCDDILEIREICKKKLGTVNTTDTAIYTSVALNEQKEMIYKKLDQIKKSSVVITNRLHGVIFSAITGTPCIAIGNYNHKVRCVCALLKDLNYIHYIDKSEELSDILNALDLEKKYNYSNEKFLNYYDALGKEFVMRAENG